MISDFLVRLESIKDVMLFRRGLQCITQILVIFRCVISTEIQHCTEVANFNFILGITL